MFMLPKMIYYTKFKNKPSNARSQFVKQKMRASPRAWQWLNNDYKGAEGWGDREREREREREKEKKREDR